MRYSAAVVGRLQAACLAADFRHTKNDPKFAINRCINKKKNGSGTVTINSLMPLKTPGWIIQHKSSDQRRDHQRQTCAQPFFLIFHAVGHRAKPNISNKQSERSSKEFEYN